MKKIILTFAIVILSLSKTLAIGCVPVGAGEVCPNPPSGEKNFEVVQKYFEALKTGDMNMLSNTLSEDIVWHQPGQGKLSGVYRGKQQVFALFGKFIEISNGSFKIDSVNSMMSNGALVTTTLHFSASNNSGSISMSGVDLMQIKNGKIAEVWLFSENQQVEDNFWK